MGKPFHVIVIGAGPAGLSAALSLLQNQKSDTTTESPIYITLLELRDKVQTLGGAVNLTPLAMRYLDSLGVGERLRLQGTSVSAIELVSHRTGGFLGRLWPDVDAIRVQRQMIVESMMETLHSFSGERCEIVFGAKIQRIEEFGSAEGEGSINVTYKMISESNDTEEELHTLEGDLLLGCDGLHSQVRTQFVDPERQKTYSGKCAAYAYTGVVTSSEKSRWLRSDGKPLVTDTTLVSKGNDSLLMSYFEPSHEQLFLAAVMPLDDKSGGDNGSREGWAVHGADKAGVKRNIAQIYSRNDESSGAIACLGELIDKCDDWFFFPVYMLPPGGIWTRGRALLLGDAAHGMPPQGESTGVAIEDGVLLAHVLLTCRSKPATRTVPQLLGDYEKLRRADIDATYKETMARWNTPVPPSWMNGLVLEWLTWGYVKFMNYTQGRFDRDVRKLVLPE